MVDAGGAIADLVHWYVEVTCQFIGRALHRMAKTHLADRRIFLGNGPGVDGHWVHVLQHDGIGADCQHVLADVPEMRHGAQAPHDAAHAQRIGNGLAQAEALGHLEVGHRAGLVSADLESDDDEIRLVQRAALVVVGLDLRGDAEGLHDLACHQFRFCEALRIDVHQRQRCAGECGPHEDIADDVLHEHGGAGAYERNAGGVCHEARLCPAAFEINRAQRGLLPKS